MMAYILQITAIELGYVVYVFITLQKSYCFLTGRKISNFAVNIAIVVIKKRKQGWSPTPIQVFYKAINP